MNLSEQLFELHDVSEMATANQSRTGLNGKFYFSHKTELKNLQAHSLGRVKLLKDDISYYATIKKDKSGNRKYSVSDTAHDKKLLKKFLKFVDINSNLLWSYWNAKSPEKLDADDDIKSNFKKA